MSTAELIMQSEPVKRNRVCRAAPITLMIQDISHCDIYWMEQRIFAIRRTGENTGSIISF